MKVETPTVEAITEAVHYLIKKWYDEQEISPLKINQIPSRCELRGRW